jgi:ubiquinone biosynthesis protein UbiJ
VPEWKVKDGLTIKREQSAEDKLDALQERVDKLEKRLEELEKKTRK